MHGDAPLHSRHSPRIGPRSSPPSSSSSPPLRMLLDVPSNLNLNLNQGDAKQLVLDHINHIHRRSVHGFEPSRAGCPSITGTDQSAEENGCTSVPGVLISLSNTAGPGSGSVNSSSGLPPATDLQSLSAHTSTMSNITSASGEASISSGEMRPGGSSSNNITANSAQHHHHHHHHHHQMMSMQYSAGTGGPGLHITSPTPSHNNNNSTANMLQLQASVGTSSVSAGASNGQLTVVVKRRRNLPGTPDPDAEVIALSPKTLMATNRFVCEICNKGFQRDQNLQLHRRGHNLPWKLKQRANKEVRKKVYICPEPSCVHHDASRALGDLTGIKKHFCRKHGEKKWKCDKCSKRYAVHSDWKAHSKTCGTREYRCDCGTLFSRRDSFITHRAFCDALAEESARVNTAGGHMMMMNNMSGSGIMMQNQSGHGGPLSCNSIVNMMQGSSAAASTRPPTSPSTAMIGGGHGGTQLSRLGGSGITAAAVHLLSQNMMDPHLLAASRTTTPHPQGHLDSIHNSSSGHNEQQLLNINAGTAETISSSAAAPAGGKIMNYSARASAAAAAQASRLSLWPPAASSSSSSAMNFPASFMGGEAQLDIDSFGSAAHNRSTTTGSPASHNSLAAMGHNNYNSNSGTSMHFGSLADHNIYEAKPLISSQYSNNNMLLQMSTAAPAGFMPEVSGFPNAGLSSDQFAGLSSFANRQLNINQQQHHLATLGGQAGTVAAGMMNQSPFNLQAPASSSAAAQMSATALLQKAAQMGATSTASDTSNFFKGLAAPDYSSTSGTTMLLSHNMWPARNAAAGTSSTSTMIMAHEQHQHHRTSSATNLLNMNLLGQAAPATAASDHHHLFMPPPPPANTSNSSNLVVDHHSSSDQAEQQQQIGCGSRGQLMNSASAHLSMGDHHRELGAGNSSGGAAGHSTEESAGIKNINSSAAEQHNTAHHLHHQQQLQLQQQKMMMMASNSAYIVPGGHNLNRLFNTAVTDSTQNRPPAAGAAAAAATARIPSSATTSANSTSPTSTAAANYSNALGPIGRPNSNNHIHNVNSNSGHVLEQQLNLDVGGGSQNNNDHSSSNNNNSMMMMMMMTQGSKVPKSEDGVTRDFLGVQLIRPEMMTMAMIQEQHQQQQQQQQQRQQQLQQQHEQLDMEMNPMQDPTQILQHPPHHHQQQLYYHQLHQHPAHHLSSLYNNNRFSSTDHHQLHVSNASTGSASVVAQHPANSNHGVASSSYHVSAATADDHDQHEQQKQKQKA